MGTDAPKLFTFAWDPVPLADRYASTVLRRTCARTLETTNIDPQDTSLQIERGTLPGEV